MKSGINTGKHFYPNSFTVPAITFYTMFFVLPTVVGFVFAFTNWNTENLTDWFAVKFVGLDHFIYLFHDPDFILALKNTLIFAFTTSIMKILIGLILALALNESLKSRNFLRTVFFVPAVISVTAVGLLFSAIFSIDGIVNQFIQWIGFKDFEINWLGDLRTAFSIVNLLEIWKWSGLAMVIFLAGLQSIPKNFYEAARIDGASPLRQLLNITLPMLAPAITINVTLHIIGGFKVFDQVYVLTNGQLDTEVLNTLVYRAFSNGLYGRASAMSMVLFILVAIISVMITSYFKKREVQM